MRVVIGTVALALVSCTYAPRNTSIDQTYNARQMAVGVATPTPDAMTTTISSEEVAGEGDGGVAQTESNVLQENDLQESRFPHSNPGQRHSVPALDFITIGSSKSDVVRVQGTPTEIKDWSWGDEWWFGYSLISFDTHDRVKEWKNRGNLKVKMQAY